MLRCYCSSGGFWRRQRFLLPVAAHVAIAAERHQHMFMTEAPCIPRADRQSWPPRSANGLLHRTFCRRPERRGSDGPSGRVWRTSGLLGILTFRDQSPLIARSRWLLRGIIGSLSYRLPRLQQRPVSQNTNLTIGPGLVRRRACRNYSPQT